MTLKRFPPRFRSADELRDLQSKGLAWTVGHAWRNSPFYRARLEAAGITPADVRSLDDLSRVPFTTADDLAADYPFPLRAAPFGQIVRIHSSSGTTGRRKVLCYTRRDLDDWADMFGRCYELAGLSPEDRVQICVGYGLWTAGVGFQLGCERFGAMAVPTGPGNLEMQCGFLVDLQSTVLCSTASMALLLAEEVEKKRLRGRIGLRKVILGAERSSAKMIATIKALLGIDEVYDIPGLTELYGPGTGLSCRREAGIHYWADYYILEVVDPGTLAPARPGEVGEMVYTTLSKEGAPLLRYRSRDLTRLVEGDCPCGCTLPRHDKILGRSDDMFIVRGVNVYPGQLDALLSKIPGLGSEYQVHLERRDDGKDYMTIRIERAPDAPEEANGTLAKAIASEVRHVLLVSAAVEPLPYGTLPRSEKKTRRVFDARD